MFEGPEAALQPPESSRQETQLEANDIGGGIIFDRARFAEQRRMALYAYFNGALVFLAEMQRRFALKPGEAQICLLVHTASIQRVVRDPHIPDHLRGNAPVPVELANGISRRQIARVTGLSREAVRRCVAMLLARELVIEKSPGRLIAPPGFLLRVEDTYPTEAMLAPILAVFETFVRLGVVRTRT